MNINYNYIKSFKIELIYESHETSVHNMSVENDKINAK